LNKKLEQTNKSPSASVGGLFFAQNEKIRGYGQNPWWRILYFPPPKLPLIFVGGENAAY